MEQKKLYQVIIERLAADPDLRERVLNANEDELTVMLEEQGITQIPKEQAKKLLQNIKSVFNENGKLDDAALGNVAAGLFMCAPAVDYQNTKLC